MDCKECDSEIPEKRLKAKPNVVLCIDCQEKAEKEGKFKRSKIEISQEIEGWQYAGNIETLIPGDS